MRISDWSSDVCSSDLMQTRSFCYVADLTEALERLMNSPEHVAGPVNIGNPVELTVLDLAKRVLALTGSQSIIKYRPLPIEDPTLRPQDVQPARELLRWQHVTDLHIVMQRPQIGRP